MYTNQQTKRNILHHTLIDLENKPCSNPECATPFYKRQIHRIIAGGEYKPYNILVRCFNCHRADHPYSKFRIGETVIINGRTPRYIDLARHRPRTIIAIYYNSQKQCNFYTLGSNGKGACNDTGGNPQDGYGYSFRSYMLAKPRVYHFINHRYNVLAKSQDKHKDDQTLKVDVDHALPRNFDCRASIDIITK